MQQRSSASCRGTEGGFYPLGLRPSQRVFDLIGRWGASTGNLPDLMGGSGVGLGRRGCAGNYCA
jgi:hypothetical protein